MPSRLSDSSARWAAYFEALAADHRATRATLGESTYWVAAERAKTFAAIFPDAAFDVVLSQFGHIFAPRPARATAELLRHVGVTDGGASLAERFSVDRLAAACRAR